MLYYIIIIICTYLHIPEAGSCPGAFPAGLWQRRVGGYSCPPNAPTPVGSGCSGTAYLKRSDHITDALVSLHWLRVLERIQYKIAVLSYKVLHDTAPRYLGPPTRVADIPGRRALRSACTDRMEVPYFKLSTIGGRAFPVSASQIWNSLPDTVVSASTLRSFQHQSKTFFISTILYLLAL